MARMYPQQDYQGRRPVPPRPQRRGPRRPRWEFRWVPFVIIPGTLLLTLWLINGAEPHWAWDDVMTYLRVNDRQQYTQLACLGLIGIAIAAIARIARGPRDEEEK